MALGSDSLVDFFDLLTSEDEAAFNSTVVGEEPESVKAYMYALTAQAPVLDEVTHAEEPLLIRHVDDRTESHDL